MGIIQPVGESMRAVVLLFLCFVLPLALSKNYQGAEIEDNDFAEFEDFDDDEEFEHVPMGRKDGGREEGVKKVVMSDPPAQQADEDDAMVEDEDDEFEHLTDEEEFEGFDPDFSGAKKQNPPDLKITKVPLHLTTNWDSFYLEILMVAGLGVYFLNFLAGKTKNGKLAQAFVNAHRGYLETQFSVVGDDGTTQEPMSNVLMKESENVYNLWCSGRVCCEGMLVTLKLLKRQDLVSTISRLFSPKCDQIIVKMVLEESKEPQDNFVFCVANKKVIAKLHKETQDLAWYCAEKKQVDKQRLPASFQMLTEIGEVANILLDQTVAACLTQYEKQVEYIHISDQYCGAKLQDEAPTTMPVTERVLLFCFNVPGEAKASPRDMEAFLPLIKLVFHLTEKVRRCRLTKEGKTKSEKNRQKVQEVFMKQAHSQRTEAAQARKEDKRRAEKDKMMAEEDPDKQRRMEERSIKKDKNKKPRMKMVKMKAM